MNLFPQKYNLNNNVNTILLIMFIMVLFTIVFYTCFSNSNNVVKETKFSTHSQESQTAVNVKALTVYSDSLQTK